MQMKQSDFDYLHRPKQFDEQDFWRQVRRTINGNPVSEDQILLIEKQISNLLQLKKEDSVLDIGCGNGALTDRLSKYTGNLYGIDHSEYLIEIANKYFAGSNKTYIKSSMGEFIEKNKSRGFSKCLMYGVSSFLEDDELEALICWFFGSNNQNRRLLFGNVRDIEQAHLFYQKNYDKSTLNDTSSAMGKWRSQSLFHDLTEKHQLKLKTKKMPSNFYASTYYFDAVIYSP